MSPADIVNKLWNHCSVLRDDGMSYGDYVEQLTYLLFLKMADERTKVPYLLARGAQASNQESPVSAKWSWPELVKRDGEELFEHYCHTLETLGNKPGLLGLIFNKSQNKFQDPGKLRRASRIRQSILSSVFSLGRLHWRSGPDGIQQATGDVL